jgi:hypothetical protein
MSNWHRQYNVSGTVDCGPQQSRVEAWCGVLRSVLCTDEIGTIAHMTGAISVFAFSAIGDVASCGHDVHEFWALARGSGDDVNDFAAALKSALEAAGLSYSLTVHDSVRTLP